MPGPTALSLTSISRRFGPVVALDDVTVEIRQGEIHALLGENGAGKSTLMHIAYGMIQPDHGAIRIGSAAPVAGLGSPRIARSVGIGMVHQHFTSLDALTVTENIALFAGWREVGGAACRRADILAGRLGLALPINAPVATLSVQLRQRLEIVKALAADAQVLLLDEPTAVLAPREVVALLEFLRGFARRGGAVALITHKLREVFEAADRVTVLRRGRVTLDGITSAETEHSLSQAMIGGGDLVRGLIRKSTTGVSLITARDLTIGSGRNNAPSVVGAGFEVHAGEIVGLAAVDGNGQRELLRAVAGIDEVVIQAGELSVTGPVAFIPDDRIAEGSIASFSLTENLLLGRVRDEPVWLDWPALAATTARVMTTFDVRAPAPATPIGALSGGNQQKFVVGRALSTMPRVIVADSPTRGLDLHATAAIHQILRAAAARGAAVLVHSSDLDELLTLSDRMLVVAGGVVREVSTGATREEIGDMMLGLAAV